MATGFAFAATANAQDASPPNVVVILADDLGYGDAQCYNPDSTIPTPHLDAVAAQGMRFTDAHTPSAVCTPTRYGLLTGRYCWRSRMKRGVLNGYSPHLIEPGRATLAGLMQTHGYHTACIGKWHLGMDMLRERGVTDTDYPIENGPTTNGFDHFYGVTASLDMPPYVYVEDDRFTAPLTDRIENRGFPSYWREGEIAEGFVHREALDQIVGHAQAYIHERVEHDQPFFLYLPLTSPHKPTLPAKRFTGRSGLGPYGDFIIQTDDVVGRIDQALSEAGVFDNTLVIVTSDNGSYMFRRPEDGPDHTDDAGVQGYHPDTHTANGELRGTKADIYEAGHRVYFAARWPGVIEAGSVAEQTVSLVDVYATLAELVGEPLPDDAAEDSYSMLGLLRGEAGAYDRGAVVMHSASGMFAIRQGRWKLIAGDGSGGRERPRGTPFTKPYQLYDLEADLSEQHNVAGEHPDVVAELEALLQRYRDEGRSR